MIHGSLYTGMGGFDLAAEWMGWENLFHCENNPVLQRVLKYYWPLAQSHGDMTKTCFKQYANKIDVLSGGFPCQPYSTSGKRRGTNDERDGWPEVLRAIREIRPRWFLGENVYGFVTWNAGLVFNEAQTDLENEGYQVQPYILPAVGINAPHRRYRVFIVAHSDRDGYGRELRPEKDRHAPQGGFGETQQRERVFDEFGRTLPACHASHTESCRRTENYGQRIGGFNDKTSSANYWQDWPLQSPILPRNDGFSRRLDGLTFSKWKTETKKAAGNAVMPQMALRFFRAIEQYEDVVNNQK